MSYDEPEHSSDDDELDIPNEHPESVKKNEHPLEVRRTIEDHLERTRLQKELDYLYDDDLSDFDEE